VGIFLRIYRLPTTVMFQGDQGRDAIIVKHLIIDHHPPLLGPVTSVGNMYLGPFYYYFMAPWLLLTYPNPIGPAYGIALISILTLPLIYLVGKDMIGRGGAIVALLLMALADPVVLSSRFSWNPNLAPIVSLGIIWAMFQTIKYRRYQYLLLASVAFGILTQLHYLALIMGPFILGWWIFSFLKFPHDRRQLFKYTVGAIIIYLLSWIPLVIFDLTHQGLIRTSFLAFFFSPEEHLQPINQLLTTIKEMEGRALQLLVQVWGGLNYWFNRILVYIAVITIGWLTYIRKLNYQNNIGFIMVTFGVVLTISLSALYQGTIFNHYLLFAFPLVSYFWGFILMKWWKIRLLGPGVVLSLLVAFGGYNIIHATSFAPAAPSISQFQMIVDTIKPHLLGGKYNLVLLSESKDYKGMNYRYFFETSANPSASIDDYQNLTQLVVIDEIKVIDPQTVNIYEIKEPQLMKLMTKFSLPNGPTIYIYQ
jgi:hypothetical protein